MFTGIIETIGTITSIRREGTSIALAIRPDRDDFQVAAGGSVAVDGVCLTLEKWDGGHMRFSAVAETLSRTTLSGARAGVRINLERALIIGSRLDGHFVYGHVDGTGVILHDKEMDGSVLRTIAVPQELFRFMAQKGSVAIDGVSLTIASCGCGEITISLIPHTLQATTMSLKKGGDAVNIECDIVARYLQQLLQAVEAGTAPAAESLLSLMERSGF